MVKNHVPRYMALAAMAIVFYLSGGITGYAFGHMDGKLARDAFWKTHVQQLTAENDRFTATIDRLKQENDRLKLWLTLAKWSDD